MVFTSHLHTIGRTFFALRAIPSTFHPVFTVSCPNIWARPVEICKLLLSLSSNLSRSWRMRRPASPRRPPCAPHGLGLLDARGGLPLLSLHAPEQFLELPSRQRHDIVVGVLAVAIAAPDRRADGQLGGRSAATARSASCSARAAAKDHHPRRHSIKQQRK